MISTTLKDRYRIVRVLGSGGSATVYEAFDLEAKVYVAVKVLHPEFSRNKILLERFQREIRAAQSFRSPLIVSVLDWGVENNTYFIIFELVEGKTLRQVISQRGKLPLEESLSLAVQMLTGIEEAHQAQIIHRDLKPENIMVTPSDEIKLMDFGIAKDTTMDGLTHDGTMIGTPHYISPEQAKGEKVDARSDVYAIGAVLYEMLSGHPPFEADTHYAVIVKHINEVPISLSQRNPEIPLDLDNLIQRALAKDPAKRYQSAAEMATVLRRYLEVIAPIPQISINSSYTNDLNTKFTPADRSAGRPANRAEVFMDDYGQLLDRPANRPVGRPADRPKATASAPRKRTGWLAQLVRSDGSLTSKGIMIVAFAMLTLFVVLAGVIITVVTAAGSTSTKKTTPTPLVSLAETTSSLLPTITPDNRPTNSPTASATSAASKDAALFQNGVAAIAAKDWKLAISIFEDLSARGYKPQEVTDRLGVAYCTSGIEQATATTGDTTTDDASALQVTLENCLKVSPDNTDAQTVLDKIKLYREGAIFASQQNWLAAFPPLESLYALDKNFRGVGPLLFDAYLKYMTALVSDKRYNEALPICEKAKAIDVGGNPDQADAQCKKIRELNATPVVVVRTYAVVKTPTPVPVPTKPPATLPPPPPTAIPPTPVPPPTKPPAPTSDVIRKK
ncbi:MAG: serine/threonine protein kinase [Chloroflexi bacterium]|nr:serine/threonine protein kinase [Chloroflexota bacterium]